MYLGAHVSNKGGTEDDIKARLGKARVAYNKLDKFWKNSPFIIKTKINVFKSSVISVLLYGCKTWRTTKGDEKKLDAFLHKSLRRILKIYWPMRIINEEVRRRAGIRETISDQVARRRWTWLDHVLRIDHHSHPRIALTWVPEGKRKRGRTTRNKEKNSGKGDQGQRVKVMGGGGNSSEGQNNLEGESVRPNSPLGETRKLMMMMICSWRLL